MLIASPSAHWLYQLSFEGLDKKKSVKLCIVVEKVSTQFSADNSIDTCNDTAALHIL